jgi:hypothetical protein
MMIREAHAPDALAIAWVQVDSWRTTRSHRTAVAVGGGGQRIGVVWHGGKALVPSIDAAGCKRQRA